jgi:hypothetical protein
VDACNPPTASAPDLGAGRTRRPRDFHLSHARLRPPRSPPFALAHALDPSGLGHAAHSLVGSGTPRSRNADTYNVDHMFGDWLQGFNKTLKIMFLLGAAIFCWALWICRNDLVFKKKLSCSPLQVILSVTHWLSSWAILQREEVQPLVATGSRLLGRTAMAFFPGHMGGDLVFVLITTRFCFGTVVSYFSWLHDIGRSLKFCTKALYPLDVMYLVTLI